MKTAKRVMAIVLLLTLFSGCGKKPNAAANKDISSEQIALTLYTMKDDMKINQYISDFKKVYPSATITRESFENAEQMDERLTTELNAGKGPDIIIFSSQTSMDVIYMAKNGAFMPLDEKIEADTTLNSDDYLPTALDAGKVNGVQYILPLNVQPMFIWYDANSIPLDKKNPPVLTHQQFIDMVEADMDRLKDDESKASFLASRMLLQFLISSQVISMSDDRATVEYEEEDLRTFIDWMRLLEIDHVNKAEKVLSMYGWDYYQMAKNFTYIGMIPSVDIINDAWTFSNYYREAVNGNSGVFALSEVSGEGNLAALLSSYGVLTKQAGIGAYEFLRIAMDSNPRSSNIASYGISLNKKNIKEQIKKYKESTSTINYKDTVINIKALDNDTADDLQALFDSINHVVIQNPKIAAIFLETLVPYWDSKKPFDECYKDFTQRINLYMTE